MALTLKDRLLAIGIFGTIIVGSVSRVFAVPLAHTDTFAKAVPAKDFVNIRWRHRPFDFATPPGLDRLRFFFRHHRFARSYYYRTYSVGALSSFFHRRFWRRIL
jgi:hypothetical protein